MRIPPKVFAFVALALFQVGYSNSPTSPKPGVIAVSVNAGANHSVKGITVSLLQTAQTKTTDSTGVAAFDVDPGSYTVRVTGLQGPGPALQSIDSTVQIQAGQIDTLSYIDCLGCV